MIEIRNVRKSYGDTVVVDDVSLTLPGGGVTAVIGPNGAGKSTLLTMIGRLLPMDSGQILVDGLDVTRAPSGELARRLSILRQENHIAARLTVRDLVAFGRYPHSGGRLTPADRAHVERAMDFLGVTHLAGRFLDELSGGQRQRVHVAMVVCQDTDYVLLDEPLNNLDMKHAVQMMQLMRRMADDLGKTIVVVLHDINFASVYADHIVAMRHGRVLRQGPPREMMTPEAMREIYDIDMRIEEIGGDRIGVYYRQPA
ncbi:ABC transporter ATP-binding protein [Camelimonas abortus]|uniref:ABC transporter ATP-binding protein n=1 Tax=Camelimonas abortus TaxID=1017184 RepID=A0ABV7LBA4_9HYPH